MTTLPPEGQREDCSSGPLKHPAPRGAHQAQAEYEEADGCRTHHEGNQMLLDPAQFDSQAREQESSRRPTKSDREGGSQENVENVGHRAYRVKPMAPSRKLN